MEGKSLDEKYMTLCDTLKTLEKRYVPVITVQEGKRKHTGPKNSRIKDLLTNKNRHWKQFKKSATNEAKVLYTKARNKLRSETRKLVKAHEKEIAKCAKIEPKKFWKYVNSKRKNQVMIPDLIDKDGVVHSSNENKADVLRTYFESVYIKDDETTMPTIRDKYVQPFTNIIIEREDVLKRLKSLKVSKSMGPDKLNPRILNELSCEIVDVIVKFFQESIDSGQVPNLWKSATVTAIHKKGKKTDPSNYRPISLTCILCKVLEGIVRSHMLEYFLENDQLCKEQFGFVPKRSATLQLLNVMDKWMTILDEGGNIDVIFCDIMKAFDTVPIGRLLAKVRSYGIGGNLLSWIRSFLTDRTMTVLVNGEKSKEGKVTSGVPQGSVLGPLLFVIYMNDMPAMVNSFLFMFADDTKMFREIKDETDNVQLQSDLDSLSQWSRDWKLQFHPEKCAVMHIGRTNPKYSYHFDNYILNVSKVEKDLGVLVDEKLRFDEHIQGKIGKARQIWGLIRRSFIHMDSDIFSMLFKSLVRPHLEYANFICSPHTKGLATDIESVQRRATKQIPGFDKLSYPERLKKLKLPTLKHRRRRGELIEMFKIITAKYDPSSVPTFEFYPNECTTRGHNLRVRRPQSRTNTGHQRFMSKVIPDWNSLPASVVQAPSVNAFKNRLDKHFEHDATLYDPEL